MDQNAIVVEASRHIGGGWDCGGFAVVCQPAKGAPYQLNEPLLSAQPLWCPAGCPMQTSELLRYYAGTWPSLANTTVAHGANTTAGETPWGGVLDAGLGGSVGGWVDALTRRVTAV